MELKSMMPGEGWKLISLLMYGPSCIYIFSATVAQLPGSVQDLYKKTRSLIYGDTYATEQIQGKVFLDILVLFMA